MMECGANLEFESRADPGQSADWAAAVGREYE
jgi:hypothetical protein